MKKERKNLRQLMKNKRERKKRTLEITATGQMLNVRKESTMAFSFNKGRLKPNFFYVISQKEPKSKQALDM